MMTIPTRGERNNNPGNLDRNTIKWAGMAQDQSPDARFIVFSAPEFGIRALAQNLLSYYRRHGLNTVRGIVNRWAPPVENDTGAYVNAVAAQVGVNPDDTINVTDEATLDNLVRGIIHHENGRVVYDDSIIAKGIEMALA